ncbi:MAG: cytochrome b/b6 domain-containing protein [Acidobacteriota bacterium]
MCTRIVTTVLGLCLWGVISSSLAASPAEECSTCHQEDQKLKASAHATVACGACHPKHEQYPHPAGLKKPACGQCHARVAGDQARSAHGEAARRGNAAAPTCAVCHGHPHELKTATAAEFHKAVPQTCGMCHGEIAQQFNASVHGAAVTKGVRDAPVCTSCHGEHSILSPSSRFSAVHHTHIPETCGHCHGDLKLSRKFGLPADRLISFEESFHGLAVRAGSQSVADCASCHGYHDILPSKNPKSRTHPNNLAETCGHCHPGAGKRFAQGTVHLLEGGAEPVAARWARIFYQIAIPLTVGLMLVHNAGDWIRKLSQRRLRRAAAPIPPPAVVSATAAEPRMMPLERLQHALLAVSFMVLVWTGFALKYPETWWAWPLVRWESAFPVRATVHRVASVVLIATAVLHAAALAFSPRLRRRWRGSWPCWRDVPDALACLAYNLGLRQQPRQLPEHTYVAKAEYWAVVWGTVVMAITGVILWANDIVLRWLPKSVIDFSTTVHFYEAVLAGLSILVWHFYAVIFDPDVYPMDTAWLTGYSVKPHEPAATPVEEHEPVTAK